MDQTIRFMNLTNIHIYIKFTQHKNTYSKIKLFIKMLIFLIWRQNNYQFIIRDEWGSI
jgi:hypothetical protein